MLQLKPVRTDEKKTKEKSTSVASVILKIICLHFVLTLWSQLDAGQMDRGDSTLGPQSIRSCQLEEDSQALARNLIREEGAIIRGPLSEKRLALVFTADSYGEGLPSILSVLGDRSIKASFFLTGNFLRQPELAPLVKKMIENGHYVGPHSDRHLLYCDWQNRRKTLVSRSEFLSDLENNYAELARFGLNKETSPYFLPPYEWYNQEIANWAEEAGLVLVNFTPGTSSNADYTTPDDPNYVSSEEIYRRILSYEKSDPYGLNGFILLIHPGTAPARTDKFYARLGELLDELSARGYLIARIDELLAAAREEKELQLSARNSNSKNYIPSLSTLWTEESPGKITGIALPDRERVFWTTEQGQLFLAKTESGQIIKSLESGSKSVWPPSSSSGGLWLATDSEVWLINGKGDPVRKMNIGFDLIFPPVENNGLLYLIGQSRQEARQPSSGEMIWQNSLIIDSSVAPAWGTSSLFCRANSGPIVSLDKKTGRMAEVYQPSEKISLLAISPDGQALFIGTESGRVLKYNLRRQKVSWSISLGSQRVEHFIIKEKNLYVLTSGAVLYKLSLNRGHLQDWQPISSRPGGRPLIFSDEIIVPSLGNVLFGFELKSLRNSSKTVFPAELATDLALRPAAGQPGARDLLIAGLYDYALDKSLVVALVKEPQIFIETSPPSPQAPGQKIVITVRTSGFSRPKYEFYLRAANGQEKLGRKASASNTWTWLPVKEGQYTIVVKVSDKKLTGQAELRYNITRILK
ncbi:MAG TPA: polysaccharide deacetylase family protein [Candidatus Saccharicenans sp.]|nr:polysaccharide deacetylase family protein [Candidatus Saccharicenans sp.]